MLKTFIRSCVAAGIILAGSAAAQSVPGGSFEGTIAPWAIDGPCAGFNISPGQSSTGNPQPSAAADGTRFAHVFPYAQNAVCYLYLDVPITASANQLTLSAASGFNNGATSAADTVTAEVATPAGVVLVTLYSRTAAQVTDANFNTYSADLRPYIGQTVRIRYGLRIQANCCATIYADAVSLTAPAPTPTPVPTMTEWAMIVFGIILAGGAALYLQRRRLTA